ncbi:MAG: hypothetical protein LBJ15_00425 [Comamonas sp.]|jgi:hypothetical protein|uniref:hypothetical protein n=1 Tax=Comamonas sp. TaxID=34028 RepID=UPI0028257071|nr:hypothetical protein [Comamonas sp.]MDR0212452.1 hypothetical protein [Comamonas sp.]
MPVDQQADESLNPLGNLVVSAMYTAPGSLQGKLKAIWMLAAELVSQTEVKHGKLVKELWGRSAPEHSSLALKAQSLPRQESKPKNTLVQAYADLLLEVAAIHDRAVRLQLDANTEGFQLPLEDAAFFTALLTSENLHSESFLNKVVPHFFAMQLHCYRLYQMLDSPLGAPADPIARQGRASKGGKAKAVGEDVLKSCFSDFLASKAGSTFSSFNHFFDEFEEQLENTLQAYQRDHLGKHHPTTSRKIASGKGLTVDGLERKFLEWRRSAPTFKERWEKLVPPKKKAS